MPTTRIAPRFVDVWHGEHAETARIAVLPVEAIFIPAFQRERKMHHRAIAGEFDRTAYLIPIVIEYHGDYLGIDGQQRLAAMDVLGIREAAVLLVQGVKHEKRAAQLYLRYNRDRRGLSAFEKFIGAHASGDPGTIEIAKILSEYDLRAGKSAAAADAVPAGAVTSIHDCYGADVLRRVLDVRYLAWGDTNDRESRESKTLHGIAFFLRSYFEKVEDVLLVETLRKQHPAAILSRVKGAQIGTFESRYTDYVREAYNRALPRGSKKRLP